MKTQVLKAIGETALNRFARVHGALAANDRIKYYFTLLQAALFRADRPEHPVDSLKRERLACGIDDAKLDQITAGSRREAGRYWVPGWGQVMERLREDLRVMAAPLLEESPAPPGRFEERLDSLLASIPMPQDDWLEGKTVSEITRTARREGDSVHQLVMDMHKALNALADRLAEERLDGAAVSHLDDADRPLVAAFMAGLHRTAPLKFNHPGLATTATRLGTRLVIQNDMGTTDAHVLVIHVEGLIATVTYTDVHPERLRFFREMLKSHAVEWSGVRTDQIPSGSAFHLATGGFEAKDADELARYLSFLGSRLVFLIDWNRARKQLRNFLRAPQRITLLEWSAESEVGHRGFLELGGASLINQAIEGTAGSAMHFGDRLCDVLGDELALHFLQFVFRAAMEGLRDHQSPGLIQDRVRAELRGHFTSEGKRLLLVAGEHAATVWEIASVVRDGIRAIGCGDPTEHFQRLAKRARRFEHSADELVAASRDTVRRRPEYAALFRLLATADNAADELEEVAFLLELLSRTNPGGEALNALGALSDLLVEAAQEWIKALSHAASLDGVRGAATDENAGEFLTAVDALFAIEHRADDAERALTHAAVEGAQDFRQLHLYSGMARSLEAAADALKWAGLNARDYLFGSVLGA